MPYQRIYKETEKFKQLCLPFLPNIKELEPGKHIIISYKRPQTISTPAYSFRNYFRHHKEIGHFSVSEDHDSNNITITNIDTISGEIETRIPTSVSSKIDDILGRLT